MIWFTVLSVLSYACFSNHNRLQCPLKPEQKPHLCTWNISIIYCSDKLILKFKRTICWNRKSENVFFWSFWFLIGSYSCTFAFFCQVSYCSLFYLWVHYLLSLKATLSDSTFKTNYPSSPQNSKSTRIFMWIISGNELLLRHDEWLWLWIYVKD